MKLVIILSLSLSLVLCSIGGFKVGETLNYNAYFGNLPAASATLEIIDKEYLNGASVYHVRFSAKSKGLVNYIFPINDRIDLWLERDSLLTMKEILKIKEGGFKRSQEMVFNHDDNIVIVNSDTLKIPYQTHSPYSLFYFFRRKDLNYLKGKPLYTTNGKRITSLEIEVENNVDVRVPAGKFNCTKVTPVKTSRREFKNKSHMSILFSNDIYRYPIKIWLTMKYGSLVLELESITN